MSKQRHIYDVQDIIRSWDTGVAVASICGKIKVLTEKGFKRGRNLPQCPRCEEIQAAFAGTGQAQPVDRSVTTVKGVREKADHNVYVSNVTYSIRWK